VVPSGPAGGAGTRAGASYIWEHAGQERKCFFLNTHQTKVLVLILSSISEIAGSNLCQGTYPKVAVASLDPCAEVLIFVP
jgi:hypothetical protein